MDHWKTDRQADKQTWLKVWVTDTMNITLFLEELALVLSLTIYRGTLSDLFLIFFTVVFFTDTLTTILIHSYWLSFCIVCLVTKGYCAPVYQTSRLFCPATYSSIKLLEATELTCKENSIHLKKLGMNIMQLERTLLCAFWFLSINNSNIASVQTFEIRIPLVLLFVQPTNFVLYWIISQEYPTFFQSHNIKQHGGYTKSVFISLSGGNNRHVKFCNEIDHLSTYFV